MDSREVSGDRDFLLTLAHGEEWREAVATFAADHDVQAGWFLGTGAVQDAELRYYDQDAFEFETVRYEERLAVPVCLGSIAVGEDGPIVDAHVVLARESGQSIAGALDRATAFFGELSVRTFEEPLERHRDPSTDRATWTL
ncbi:MAG: PPC domain-containing DNA-binding protein [Halanaeroarchaeum sp.]